ncbi:uncharacterized protein BYT42DRAFT_572944 [Radiomyces spectabilis]|uniref:uncharacterized protein n=1 Tax=Radiomyces spectabilis TaxID=64574 RepID=UPI002220A9B4|nr:uncharacterized protein BYT42DRAFT_572944 [Radiomyces spectabilis]KAI8375969.1 hypothetical protein BYT42DRAFT_572944 [Radiomyces spectabilis]
MTGQTSHSMALAGKPNLPTQCFPLIKPVYSKESQHKTILLVTSIYKNHAYLSETEFITVTEACKLPRYMNLAFFRRVQQDERVTLQQFQTHWAALTAGSHDDDALFFNMLRKPDCQWLAPEDLLPVLEDVVLNHPELRLLADNPMLQERYIETVICRFYYLGRCPGGRLSLAQFRRSNFTKMIRSLSPEDDLSLKNDCFSYKHFYVFYSKFWILDADHDIVIDQEDLFKYNDGVLTPRVIHRVMQCGKIAAFNRDGPAITDRSSGLVLTYLDFIWFMLSEVDKSTPMAIEYWFRCMDEDGDGIISSFELYQYWKEQEEKQYMYDIPDEDHIHFDDIIRQLNDLVQPQFPGQFSLQDLKRNGYVAERFFDTFLNFERFQIHDSYQILIRAKCQSEVDRRASEAQDFSLAKIPFYPLCGWIAFAEIEYRQLCPVEQPEHVWVESEGDSEEEPIAEFSAENTHTDVNNSSLDNTAAENEASFDKNCSEKHKESPPESSDEEDTESEDKEDDIPTSSDQESDSSIPTTPTVVADPSDVKQPWLWQAFEEGEDEQQNEKRIAEWIWWLNDSTTSSTHIQQPP